jgi:hypothetical protein
VKDENGSFHLGLGLLAGSGRWSMVLSAPPHPDPSLPLYVSKLRSALSVPCLDLPAAPGSSGSSLHVASCSRSRHRARTRCTTAPFVRRGRTWLRGAARSPRTSPRSDPRVAPRPCADMAVRTVISCATGPHWRPKSVGLSQLSQQRRQAAHRGRAVSTPALGGPLPWVLLRARRVL